MTRTTEERSLGRLFRAATRRRATQPDAGTTPEPGTPITLAAPAAGTVLALHEVADAAFASGVLGPGAAVEPSDGQVVSPVTGTVVSAMPHAYGLRSDTGVEVLVHVGIDTVALGGEHFTPQVHQGQHVTAGAALVDLDLAAVAAAGYPTTVILVVTNSAEHGAVEPCADGTVEAGQPLVLVAS
ncbi:MAG: PTS glucose transporter subunit IIA [Cellulomonas sp.]|uniref:PTS sugar transporter subunit IIA n=1 Tax=Cellulomonas sp. 73-92 TaxID=1895740 RepID=UPI000927B772|nr:glucose PTS transporter subunit IIA [Cellulomonas sp. 73-92]MBN9375507.1 PTS glucose transporter subunit IIA [Cellulomonas sp.]OJV75535.1 MAG: hypothetical protein BGO37_01545 [Cellulomonas sp. 73-92]